MEIYVTSCLSDPIDGTSSAEVLNVHKSLKEAQEECETLLNAKMVEERVTEEELESKRAKVVKLETDFSLCTADGSYFLWSIKYFDV